MIVLAFLCVGNVTAEQLISIFSIFEELNFSPLIFSFFFVNFVSVRLSSIVSFVYLACQNELVLSHPLIAHKCEYYNYYCIVLCD